MLKYSDYNIIITTDSLQNTVESIYIYIFRAETLKGTDQTRLNNIGLMY